MDLIDTVLGIHELAAEAIVQATGGALPEVKPPLPERKVTHISVVDFGSAYQLINGVWQELPPF
jgi:hypothetical protein